MNKILKDNQRPGWSDSFKYFLTRANRFIKLVFIEPEILLFSLLQLFLVFACFVSCFMVWNILWLIQEIFSSYIISAIIFIAWFVSIIGLFSLLIGVLNACMGAVHLFYRQRIRSTIISCLRLALSRAWQMWRFSGVDYVATMAHILFSVGSLLPSRSGIRLIRSDYTLYIWKLGTVGILPSILSGRNLWDAINDSITIVRCKLPNVALLRAGHHRFCWILGVTPVIFYVAVSYTLHYLTYQAVIIPAIIAILIYFCILKPIYIISSIDIYFDYLQETGQPIHLLSTSKNHTWSWIIFLTMFLVVLSIYFSQDYLPLLLH